MKILLVNLNIYKCNYIYNIKMTLFTSLKNISSYKSNQKYK